MGAPVVASAPVIAPVQPPAPAPAPAAVPVAPEDEGVVIAKDAAPVSPPAPAPRQPVNFVPRPVAAVPRLVNTFPQIDLNNFVRVLNPQDQAHAVHDVHAVHALPHGLTAVRTATGAPVDLSQFTFLSGGQVLV